MTNRLLPSLLICSVLGLGSLPHRVSADEGSPPTDENSATEEQSADTARSPAAPGPSRVEDAFTAFGEMMKHSVMIGTFTIDGQRQTDPRPERYEISKVVKLSKGDYWSFFARIQYGDHDVTLPIPVEVKWAGSTPVITVNNLTIPAMGTFDARVLIADHKYAGTWRHGKVGGLMYGRIEKQATNTSKTESAEPGSDEK